MRYRICSLSGIASIAVSIIMAGIFSFCQSETTPKKGTIDTTVTQANTKPVQATAAEQTEKHPPAAVTQSKKLIVYYFHTTFRCHSCNMIENLTKQAVNSGFTDQLKNDRIELKVINIEEPGNEHYVQDYKLYTKSVILSDKVNGKEQSWKNLDKVWTLLRDEQKFIDYIQTEVQALL